MYEINYELNNNAILCDLLKEISIKDELKSIIDGYYLTKIEVEMGYLNYLFTGFNNSYLVLSVKENKIGFTKEQDNFVKRIEINKEDGEIILSERTIEVKEKGWIYSILRKNFAKTYHFSKIAVLTDLDEERYAFKLETISKMIKDSNELVYCILRLKDLENKFHLNEKSDYCSHFSTHMNYYDQWNENKLIKDSIHSSKTFVNNEDVTSLYRVVDGEDKLYRIYDLYMGIKNERNKGDLNLIKSGFLSQDSFDLKRIKGITQNEEEIVGKDKIKRK